MYKPRGQGWVGHHRRGKAHPIRAATGFTALRYLLKERKLPPCLE
jgi:hypothetical protein